MLFVARKNQLPLKTKNSTISKIFEMNRIINKFLLTRDKFMLELHLQQPGFSYSARASFTKHRERFRKFRETDKLKYLYKNELDQACFAHDAAYSDNKNLANKTISSKILKDKAYKIARNHKYHGYQMALARMLYMLFDKKTGPGASVANQSMSECK